MCLLLRFLIKMYPVACNCLQRCLKTVLRACFEGAIGNPVL